MTEPHKRTYQLALLGVLAAIALVAVLVALSSQQGELEADVVIPVETKRYTYTPGTEAAIEAPLGARVILEVRSSDVTHGFAIEGYGINEEVPAGETILIEFITDKAGDFAIYCTVFCGSGHPEHEGTLHVA